MTIREEFEVLGSEFVSAFGQEQGGGAPTRVTLTRRTPGAYTAATMARAASTAAEVVDAVRSAVRQEALAAGGTGKAGLEEVYYTFRLSALAGGVPPVAGDTITDPNVTEGGGGGGKVYRIVSVDRECMDTLVRCRCRQDRGGT